MGLRTPTGAQRLLCVCAVSFYYLLPFEVVAVVLYKLWLQLQIKPTIYYRPFMSIVVLTFYN